ncbi:MAG: tetratricopeptide repeat protein [Myxococcota bacterium]
MSEDRAFELFENGDYAEAIEVFKALYEENGSANSLYNIARIYEEDGQLEEALEYYERFVHARGAGLEERQAASERADTLREILEREAASKDDSSTDAVAEPVELPPPADVGERQPADVGERPSKLAIAGYSLLGVGGATLIAGGIMAGLAFRDHRRVTGDEVRLDASDLQEGGQRKAIAADVLFGVGGALAAAGVAMVVTSVIKNKRRSDSTARRRWQLGPGPAFAGLGFSTRI